MAPAEHGAPFPTALVVFDAPLKPRETPLLWEVPEMEGE